MGGMGHLRRISDDAWKYGKPAVWLHWLTALLIAGLLGSGWYMMSIEDEPGSAWYFNQHKSFGMVLLTLVVARLLWRAAHRPAPLPDGMPMWQARLSALVQWLLYACMLLMPLLGLIGASYTKRGAAFFGIALPSWLPPDHDTAEQFFSLHSGLAVVLAALAAVHILAGIRHLLARDGVFRRMWF